MIKTPYEVDGFAFANETMKIKAEKEIEGIRYVKGGLDMSDPQVVLEVYCQLVHQQIFDTPLGYAFLRELQEYLRANPSIGKKEIPPIPIVGESRPVFSNRTGKEKAQQQPKVQVVRKVKEKNADYKVWFRSCLSICVILLLIVVGMFAVTATSDNINIINYENRLIEKYENWETKLKEKEERLRERENEWNQPR